MSETKISAQIAPLPGLGELEGLWRTLETECAGSFFTSWGFIGSLLKLTKAPPDLFVARQAGDIIGLALIARKSRPSIFGQIDGLTLNQTGVAAEDVVYIEFNDLLCREALRPGILAALATELESADVRWTELHLAGVTPDRLDAIAAAFGLNETGRKTSAAPYVDLEKVRLQGYLPLLSGNTRRQITRSRRLFEEAFGPITLRTVTAEPEIRADIAVLAGLQTARFQGTAAPSSFGAPFFTRFVEALLLSEPTQETRADLLRIEAGGTLLGLLVNFRHRGAISNYQCAFAAFPGDNQLKPGLVSHALAIEHYANESAEIYHFLGGDQQYKKSLSTDTQQMIWTRLQKHGPRLKLETFLKSAKARLTTTPKARHS